MSSWQATTIKCHDELSLFYTTTAPGGSFLSFVAGAGIYTIIVCAMFNQVSMVFRRSLISGNCGWNRGHARDIWVNAHRDSIGIRPPPLPICRNESLIPKFPGSCKTPGSPSVGSKDAGWPEKAKWNFGEIRGRPHGRFRSNKCVTFEASLTPLKNEWARRKRPILLLPLHAHRRKDFLETCEGSVKWQF